jgi:D-lactate dehydrogenase (cytochrome)
METSTVGRSDTTNIYPKTNHYLAILLFNETERKTAEDVVHRMVKRAVEMEGTVTGEHGVGLIKRDYLEHELGTNAVDAMRKVSRVLSRASM